MPKYAALYFEHYRGSFESNQTSEHREMIASLNINIDLRDVEHISLHSVFIIINWYIQFQRLLVHKYRNIVPFSSSIISVFYKICAIEQNKLGLSEVF